MIKVTELPDCYESCAAFTGIERLIGDAAMNQTVMNPINTIFG